MTSKKNKHVRFKKQARQHQRLALALNLLIPLALSVYDSYIQSVLGVLTVQSLVVSLLPSLSLFPFFHYVKAWRCVPPFFSPPLALKGWLMFTFQSSTVQESMGGWLRTLRAGSPALPLPVPAGIC